MKSSIIIGIIMVVISFFCLSCNDNGIMETSGGWVEGTVYDSGTQSAIDSVEITLAGNNPENSENRIYTDSTGYYILFSGFTSGDYVVTAVKAGYVSDTSDVYIVKDDTVTLNFELSKE